MSLDPTKQYVAAFALKKFLEELGYDEKYAGGHCRFYVKRPEASGHLPPTITLSYPELAIDGTHWFKRSYVMELVDRLSDIDPDDAIVIRAIRKLDG